jgi:mono/diheme cytochrome c family protein
MKFFWENVHLNPTHMEKTTKIALAGMALALSAGVGYAATPAENWENHCSSCHGEDGKGQTKQGKKLKLQDYTSPQVQASLKDEDMLKAILEGVKDKDTGKERMKPYKDELEHPEAEAKALVDYIRKFKS